MMFGLLFLKRSAIDDQGISMSVQTLLSKKGSHSVDFMTSCCVILGKLTSFPGSFRRQGWQSYPLNISRDKKNSTGLNKLVHLSRKSVHLVHLVQQFSLIFSICYKLPGGKFIKRLILALFTFWNPDIFESLVAFFVLLRQEKKINQDYHETCKIKWFSIRIVTIITHSNINSEVTSI